MTSWNLISHMCKTGKFVMAILYWKQWLLCDKTVSEFVHIFDIISLFAVESEEPKIGISGKAYMPYIPDCPGQSRILILCLGVLEIMTLSRKLKK